ncbi:MAG: transaldolase [Chloroflexota bacterium]|nr:transaldolase [Chloroflexota bacterium]
MTTALQQLYNEQGQSPWVDNITRGSIRSGALRKLLDEGIRGLTANPTIFQKAVSGSADYDDSVREFASQGASSSEIYEQLIVEDIRDAADVLRPLYDETNGGDGYASIEVSPRLAHDTRATIEEARRFWQAIDRPNVFIKVPATDLGIPAIRQLLSEGINVNITLIFSVEYHERVMDAYIEALEDRAQRGEPIDRLASVASFFVSRVDTEVDIRLGKLIEAEQDENRRKDLESLLGKAAIANAKIAYQRFLEKFRSERFKALREHGARVQRPLWASTGTKNPAYSDVLYVEELIGPDTVNTLPPATIEAFQDHGRVERTIDRGVEGAYRTIERLETHGVDLREVTDKLQADGIEIFIESFRLLDEAIRGKREELLEKRQVVGPAPV